MKKFILAVGMFFSALSVSALNPGDTIPAPLLVGHRGSNYGVENTEEAFRNGAKLGYQYVETDIKVTKDTKFVLCHNDDLSSFGSSLTIAGSTLAQLQAVTLTQTRLGTKYTGKIMELGEFLDLCTELNVLPVIELKWATGVNSNDQSNMPKLIQLIEEKGYRNKAIILTSMKPCLEWIYKNHPDVQRQLLVNAIATGAHLTWCIEHKTDVDISTTYCTEEAVEKYHEAGLKVNMWTTNDSTGYKTYTLMGCEFITTDRLDGNNLPVVTVPSDANEVYGETPDYKDVLEGSGIKPASSYSFRSDYVDYQIAELTGKTIRRVIDHKGMIYILAVDADKKPTILVFNSMNKEVITVATDKLFTNHTEAAYMYPCSDIAVTSCGHLIATNYAKITHATTTEVNTFWKWENDENGLPMGEPIVWVETHSAGNWTAGYAGATFAYTGDLSNGIIYMAGTTTGSGKGTRLVLTPIVNGVPEIHESTTWYHTFLQYNGENITLPILGEDYHFTLSPNLNKFVITGSTEAYTMGEVKYTKDQYRINIKASYELPAELGIKSDITHIGFFKYAGAIYAVTPTTTGVNLLNISKGIQHATIVKTTGTSLTEVLGLNAAVGHVTPTLEGDSIVRGDIDIFLLRGDKATLLTTRLKPAEIITIDQEVVELKQYYATTLTAALTPEDAQTPIIWKSTNEEIATVEEGKVIGRKEGEVQIIAQSGIISDTCVVKVLAMPETLTCEYLAGMTIAPRDTIEIIGFVTAPGATSGIWNPRVQAASFYIADTADGGEVFLVYTAKPQIEGYVPEIGEQLICKGMVEFKDEKPRLAKGGIYVSLTTDLENIEMNSKEAVKVIENGVMYIIHNNVKYNVTGIRVK